MTGFLMRKYGKSEIAKVQGIRQLSKKDLAAMTICLSSLYFFDVSTISTRHSLQSQFKPITARSRIFMAWMELLFGLRITLLRKLNP
jgi:hypothetical protein